MAPTRTNTRPPISRRVQARIDYLRLPFTARYVPGDESCDSEVAVYREDGRHVAGLQLSRLSGFTVNEYTYDETGELDGSIYWGSGSRPDRMIDVLVEKLKNMR